MCADIDCEGIMTHESDSQIVFVENWCNIRVLLLGNILKANGIQSTFIFIYEDGDHSQAQSSMYSDPKWSGRRPLSKAQIISHNFLSHNHD